MKRTFEIELNVPDDFDARYSPPHLLCPGCMFIDGMLAWTVYANPVTPAPQWRKATASDEGKFARFADEDIVGWTDGKLLHVNSDTHPLHYLALAKGAVKWFEICEVPKE
jgi:hypothetical protein